MFCKGFSLDLASGGSAQLHAGFPLGWPLVSGAPSLEQAAASAAAHWGTVLGPMGSAALQYVGSPPDQG